MQPEVNRFRKPKQKITIPERVAFRAASKYEPDKSGCWISTYSTASHGYAQIGWTDGDYRQMVTAHRAAWVFHNKGQIPEGYTVDHTCKERRCVNPAHLRCLINFENARRTKGRDWEIGKCLHGHPNSDLYWDGSKYRCRPCTKAQQAKYRENNKEKVKESKRRYAEKKKKQAIA